MQIMQSFAQDLYGQAGAEGAGAQPGDPAAAGEGAAKAPDADTVDADFEVVDDEKKDS